MAALWPGMPTVLPVHHHYPAGPAPAQFAADLTGSAIKPYQPRAWLHRSPHCGAVWMAALAVSSAAVAATCAPVKPDTDHIVLVRCAGPASAVPSAAPPYSRRLS